MCFNSIGRATKSIIFISRLSIIDWLIEVTFSTDRKAIQCPVLSGANMTLARSNTDWWPKTLNLDILHRHNTKTNPMELLK